MKQGSLKIFQAGGEGSIENFQAGVGSKNFQFFSSSRSDDLSDLKKFRRGIGCVRKPKKGSGYLGCPNKFLVR